MQVIENDPSARIQFLRRSELRLPGSCYVCGNGTCEEGYFDFGTFVDYHGHLYLCVPCLMQAASIINLLTPEEVMTQVQAMEDLLIENAMLKKQNEEYREQLVASDVVINRLYANVNPVGDSDDSSYEVESSESPSDVNDDPNPFERAKDRESEPAEPVKSGKPKRVTGITTFDVT